MARTGRPVKVHEKMSSIRVRDSQRAILEVIRDMEGGSNHEVLTRVLRFYLSHHRDVLAEARRVLRERP